MIWHFMQIVSFAWNRIWHFMQMVSFEMSWNRIWHFMQIISFRDHLHEMSEPIF